MRRQTKSIPLKQTKSSTRVDTAEADESQQDGVIRQQLIEQLMRQITHYDAEFRREDATSAVSSYAKH